MDLPVPIGHVLANKYRVDRFIAAGGMGVVVAGFHLELDQPVAIKFLSIDSEFSGEGAERFRREARAAAKIHSEHVVRVFDVGLLDEKVPYLVMELLEGNDLDEEVAARGALPISEAVGYVLQAIDAIAEAHAVGIVHRDLKPSNLYLAQRADGLRVVKVLDFGISKSLVTARSDASLTKTSALVGSPLFMSPEQMRSAKDVDTRADTWALGAILYFLLSAQEPFLADTLPQLCVAVMSEPHRPLRDFAPSVPEALDHIVSKCLSKERADRFASLAALAEALVPFAPNFRAHAERAARLLGRPPRDSITPAPVISLLPTPVPSAPQTERVSDLGTAVSAPNASSETQSAWDKTNRGSASKRRGPVIVSALVALVALVVFVASRRGTSPEPTAAAAAIPSSTESELVAAVPNTLPDVAAATPEPAVAAKAPETTANAPAPAVSAKPAVAPRAPAPQRPRPAALEKRPAATSADVTYFGGRR